MNMHRSFTAAVGLAIGFAVAAPAMAESDTIVSVERTSKHHYVYYGDHQIYFAPETRTYYWRNHDRWQSGEALPEEHQRYIRSGGVELDLDTDHPYERHEWVLKHYKHMHDRDERHERD